MPKHVSRARADASRSVPAYEKRGGYGSSSKLVTTLTPPPSGPAPGAKGLAPQPSSGADKPSSKS